MTHGSGLGRNGGLARCFARPANRLSGDAFSTVPVCAALRRDPSVREVVTIDGVRARFADGWGLVRASNTQPALVMRCEASDAARLAEIRATIERYIAEARR